MSKYRINRGRTQAGLMFIRGLALLGILASLLLINGCVSFPVGGGNSDPDAYNQATGYPAVGGDRWLGW